MTREEWDALSAREKDAIVAEKVMGWEWDGRMLCWLPYPGCKFSETWGRDAFCPTTSWGAMRLVAEKFSSFRLDKWGAGTRKGMWEAWATMYKPEAFATALATTAPEAVCLAALTALGVIE